MLKMFRCVRNRKPREIIGFQFKFHFAVLVFEIFNCFFCLEHAEKRTSNGTIHKHSQHLNTEQVQAK